MNELNRQDAKKRIEMRPPRHGERRDRRREEKK